MILSRDLEIAGFARSPCGLSCAWKACGGKKHFAVAWPITTKCAASEPGRFRSLMVLGYQLFLDPQSQ